MGLTLKSLQGFQSRHLLFFTDPNMSDSCGGHDHGHGHSHEPVAPTSDRYRRVLWVALVINAAMFIVEIAGGLSSGSVSLLADAVDFLGDAANYGLSLVVLGMALKWRARAALFKGVSMGLYGVLVLGRVAWSAFSGTVPEPLTMGLIGTLALVANVAVAVMLYAYRDGDSNRRSVWLCSRNDAIGNVAVMLAALGVFGTRTGWPDLVVAVVMAFLGLTAAKSVIKQARAELNPTPEVLFKASLDRAATTPKSPTHTHPRSH
jgi:Co/Zn/Cd efflux system component